MEESVKTASISEILDTPSLLMDSRLTLGQIQRNKTVYLQISVQELIFDSEPCQVLTIRDISRLEENVQLASEVQLL